MGRLGDISDLLTLGLVAGGGYLAYRALKGLPGLPAFEWPTWPTWSTASPEELIPVDASLTAGVDIPGITFTALIPEDAWVPRETFEAESRTRRQLADLLGAAYRKDPKISMEQIVQSERLAFEARLGGVTDF